MSTASLAALLAPSYLEGLPSLPIAEIRSRREQATEVEVGLSYVRRLIQGRLDIVLAEVHQRESGGPGGDLADLVQRLPEILGDRVRAPGIGRLPTLMAPAEVELTEVHRLDDIVDADSLGTLPQRSDAELAPDRRRPRPVRARGLGGPAIGARGHRPAAGRDSFVATRAAKPTWTACCRDGPVVTGVR